MLKNILKLDGAVALNKHQQTTISGGHNCMNETRFCFQECGGCNKGELNAQGECVCY